MALGSSTVRPRPLAFVASAAFLHLLILCAPAALIDRSVFGAANPRAMVFLFVVSAWVCIESLASGAAVRLPMKCHGPRHLPLAIGLSLLITFWVSLAENALSVPAGFGAAAAAGTSFMVAGVALRYLALRALGPAFLNEVAILPGHSLVTSGIYRWLRHPSEAGTLCLAFGGAFVLGSGVGLVVGLLLLLPGLVWRTRLEDRMLREKHAIQFGHYARRAPAFLPRIL